MRKKLFTLFVFVFVRCLYVDAAQVVPEATQEQSEGYFWVCFGRIASNPFETKNRWMDGFTFGICERAYSYCGNIRKIFLV